MKVRYCDRLDRKSEGKNECKIYLKTPKNRFAIYETAKTVKRETLRGKTMNSVWDG